MVWPTRILIHFLFILQLSDVLCALGDYPSDPSHDVSWDWHDWSNDLATSVLIYRLRTPRWGWLQASSIKCGPSGSSRWAVLNTSRCQMSINSSISPIEISSYHTDAGRFGRADDGLAQSLHADQSSFVFLLHLRNLKHVTK